MHPFNSFPVEGNAVVSSLPSGDRPHTWRTSARASSKRREVKRLTFGRGESEQRGAARELAINGQPGVDICHGKSRWGREGAGRRDENRGRAGNCVKRGKLLIFQGVRGRAGRHLPVVYEIQRRG